MDFSHLKGELIYLASPYTHEDSYVREIRFLQSSRATAWIINTHRLNVFGAITHTQALVTRYQMPVQWEFWAEYDTAFISHAKEVWVLCIPGYTNSTGVTTERKLATAMGKKIRYVIPISDGAAGYFIGEEDPGEAMLYGRVEPGRVGHPPFKPEE